MNDVAADAPVRDASQSRPDISTARVLVALIRREFWEHRALWMVPVGICGLLLVSAMLGRFGLGYGRNVPFGPFPWSGHIEAAPDVDLHTAGVAMFALRQWALSVPLYLAATVSLYFYLLSSLFDERKDRSILFWKSLPVSDAATVASKLLVALAVVPIGIFLLELVNHLLFTAIWDTRAVLGSVEVNPFIWDTMAWLKVEALMLISVVMSVLWYAPVAAYLVLISAWARRNVFLWAVLPPLIAAVVERVALGTSFVTQVFLYRLGGIWTSLGLDHVSRSAMVNTSHGRLLFLPRVFDAIGLGSLFANTGLWAGLIVAGALTYAAVRIRRYRDDT